MEFEFYDPNRELVVTEGHIPHWYQPGVATFVTFRTNDSVPLDVLRRIEVQRQEQKGQRVRPPSSADWAGFDEYSREIMDWLDRGYGACVLRRPDCTQEVASAIGHFDGIRYDVSDYVVMPNHVHVLFSHRGTFTPSGICYSWKKYSAVRINAILGRHGHFWQEESFDHLVRSAEQFEYLRTYIADNPIRAGLNLGEYILYQRPLTE
jgi:REP element-mobilizing transposase RayT